MAKRGPQSELTDRNWDDEEEPEEAGIFQQASKEAMQQRVVKKAKRRGQDESSGGVKTGAFGGFGGLMKKPGSDQNSLGKNTAAKAQPASDSLFKVNFTGGATSSVDDEDSSKNESKENSSYLHGLKSLNESVLAWIKQHVDKNPYIILTPVFKDYDKYLATLETKKSSTNGSSSDTTKSSGRNEIKSTFAKPISEETDSTKKEDKEENGNATKVQAFCFGTTSSNGDGFKSTMPAPTTGFTFGKTSTTSSGDTGFSFGKTSLASSGFSFGQSSSTSASTSAATTSGGFSFGTGSSSTSTVSTFGNSGFSFGTLAAKTIAQGSTQPDNSNKQDDDDYVPPKPEVKEITEESSVFSKRCKLFYQKDGQWAEKGVGKVHLKSVEETKTQLVVRADTNLGNILLNIMLTSALPTSRQGKNNVLLVCVPNPPLKEGKEEQKPIPMLIRVKTGEEADEFLAKIEERKALL